MGMDGRERSRKYQVANYPLHNYNPERGLNNSSLLQSLIISLR